jgi:hypothetical protein
MAEYDCNGSSWESDKARRQKAMRRRMSGEAGKGSDRRPTNETAYSLGLKLIKIKEQHGADSKEYKKAVKAWRKAVQEGL